MRSLYSLIWLVLALVWPLEPAIASQNGLALDLRAEQTSFGVNGPVRLVGTLINNDSKLIVLPAVFLPEHHFIRFEIRGPHGGLLPFRGAEIKINLLADDIVALKSGMFVGVSLDVTGKAAGNTWYEFSRKGRYTAKAIYAVPKYLGSSLGRPELWAGEVSSTVISFDIQ